MGAVESRWRILALVTKATALCPQRTEQAEWWPFIRVIGAPSAVSKFFGIPPKVWASASSVARFAFPIRFLFLFFFLYLNLNFCLNWSMIRWMWPRAVGHPLPVFSSRMSFLKVQPDELDSCGYVCRLSHYTRLHTIDYFSFSKYFISKFSLIFFWFIWFDLIVKSIDWWPDFRRGRWRLAWSQSRKSRRSHPQSWKSCHFPRSISGRFREFCLFEIILKHFDRQRLNFHFFFFPPQRNKNRMAQPVLWHRRWPLVTSRREPLRPLRTPSTWHRCRLSLMATWAKRTR